MEQDQDASAHEPLVDALARVGITVTDEGRARARRLLDDAKARRDPVKFEATRQKLGYAAPRSR